MSVGARHGGPAGAEVGVHLPAVVLGHSTDRVRDGHVGVLAAREHLVLRGNGRGERGRRLSKRGGAMCRHNSGPGENEMRAGPGGGRRARRGRRGAQGGVGAGSAPGAAAPGWPW